MAHPLESYTPERAMVVVAHPDDAEFMCAGTVAKWAAAGCEVTYVVVTNGDKGSEDPEMTPDRLAVIREAEQRAAGTILGVRNFEFLGFADGYLTHTLDVRREITRVIRKWRPDVVITFDPRQRFFGDSYPNHPDHRATGDATIDAVFPSARDRPTFPELLEAGYEPWKVRQIWLSGEGGDGLVRVDITGTLDLKKAALLAHPSQLGPEVAEMATQMSRWDSEGRDYEFAEAFRVITLDMPLPEVVAGRNG
jgi:LmbE family N-acetylglucosaminyl deacetylase